jgi:hypothetical protein
MLRCKQSSNDRVLARAYESPYRAVFAGGPFDGAVTRPAAVPPKSLDLPAHSTRRDPVFGHARIERVAHYQWASTQLSVVDELPVMVFHYQYQRSTLLSIELPFWRRCLHGLRRCLAPATHRRETNSPSFQQQGVVHVQG